ncbi:MAG: hypothetical protein WCI49_14715 [Ferruginibacter sp.]
MSIKKASAWVLGRLGTIDFTLLVFLLLFINVKLVIKVAALLLIFILRPNFKTGIKIKNPRLPVFYILVIAIAIVNYFLMRQFNSLQYTVALLTGIAFWLLCLLAVHQVKLAVEKNSTEIIHNTLLIFFLLNVAVSLLVYAGIIIETESINPFRYQGNFQKYFIGTGDYIKGISFDTSTTNAVLNSFGVIYFLSRNKSRLTLLCLATLMLTGSDITNLLLVLTLLFIFIFQSGKNQKSIIIICLLFLVVFLVKVSPQNSTYIGKAYENILHQPSVAQQNSEKLLPVKERADSILSEEEKKEKVAALYIDSMYMAMVNKKQAADTNKKTAAAVVLKEKPEIPKPNIHTPPFQHKNDTTVFQQELIAFIKKDSSILPAESIANQSALPGKALAAIQTIDFFKAHPLKLISGTGIGNFSSKLAFKTTALKIAGGYPARFTYVNPDFEKNHLALYLNYFTQQAGKHSLINTPNSTYDQLLSEYGLLGLSAFIFFYAGFFIKGLKRHSYGFPLLIFTAGLFFMEYWFEQLSVIVIFELLMFVNLKENFTQS